MRVAVTEPGHRDPASEVKEFTTVGGIEVKAFAPIDGDIPPTVGRHHSWYHGISPARLCAETGGTRLYRRRRLPTSTICGRSERRRLRPGSRIIGTLLASG